MYKQNKVSIIKSLMDVEDPYIDIFGGELQKKKTLTLSGFREEEGSKSAVFAPGCDQKLCDINNSQSGGCSENELDSFGEYEQLLDESQKREYSDVQSQDEKSCSFCSERPKKIPRK